MELSENRRALMSGSALDTKMDRAGWGMALIWVGSAILLNLGWGSGLFGLGVIILVGQFVRRYLSLPFDWFALVIGICFCLAGIGPVFGIRLGDVALLPIVSIGLGLAFVISAFARSKPA